LTNVDVSVSVLSVCFLVGLVSFVTLILAGFTVAFVLFYRAPNAPDPRLLCDLAFGLHERRPAKGGNHRRQRPTLIMS
jgi:hypothetical protein